MLEYFDDIYLRLDIPSGRLLCRSRKIRKTGVKDCISLYTKKSHNAIILFFGCTAEGIY